MSSSQPIPSIFSLGAADIVEPKVRRIKVDPVEYGHYIEPCDVNKEQGPENARRSHGIEVAPDDVGLEAVSPEPHHPRLSIPISTSSGVPTEEQPSNAKEGHHRRATILGLRKRKFWILVGLVVLLIIGAIIGGLVGGLLKPAASTPSSNLAAVNWTNPADNTTTYVVIRQDEDLSLIGYTGQTGSWTSVNISQLFDTNSPLRVRVGTPLAAVANFDVNNATIVSQLSIYFLTPSSDIMQLVTDDHTLQSWRFGDIGPNGDVSITTAPGSQLAATWRRCDDPADCDTGCVSLTFEDTDQNYMAANSTYNWTQAVATKHLAQNSSMALISMNYEGNASDYVWGFFNTNDIVGSAWEDYQKGTWWWTDQGKSAMKCAISSVLANSRAGRNVFPQISPSTLQHLAAVSFRDRKNAFVAYLSPEGTVAGKHWDPDFNGGDWRSEAQLSLVGGSSVASFSTIAMSADARFYGIVANGTVQEYEMDADDPYTFHWLGEVS